MTIRLHIYTALVWLLCHIVPSVVANLLLMAVTFSIVVLFVGQLLLSDIEKGGDKLGNDILCLYTCSFLCFFLCQTSVSENKTPFIEFFMHILWCKSYIPYFPALSISYLISIIHMLISEIFCCVFY